MAKRIYLGPTRTKKVRLDTIKTKKIYLGTDCSFSADHIWQKWDSYGAYADATEYFSGNISTQMQWNWHALFKNDYPAFNTANGTYDFSSYNQVGGEDQEFYVHSGKGTPIFTETPYPTSFGQYYEAVSGSALYWYYSGSYANRKYQMVGNGLRHYPVYNYYKGSTYYGNVEAENINAYPSNGRHSDGFWYVLVE